MRQQSILLLTNAPSLLAVKGGYFFPRGVNFYWFKLTGGILYTGDTLNCDTGLMVALCNDVISRDEYQWRDSTFPPAARCVY